MVDAGGVHVRVMAGAYASLGQAAAGPIHMRNPGALLDVRVAPGASFKHVRPPQGCVCARV